MDKIHIASKEDEIRACYPVMVQLRSHLTEQAFVSKVLSQMDDGYRLVYLIIDDRISACAGYRIGTNLAWGKYLYVDDLITDESRRSKGLGKTLFNWLLEQAKQNGCAQLHLDSGLKRMSAHRFYERENMIKAGYHFVIEIVPDASPE